MLSKVTLSLFALAMLSGCESSPYFENCHGNPKPPTTQDSEDGRAGWKCDINDDELF